MIVVRSIVLLLRMMGRVIMILGSAVIVERLSDDWYAFGVGGGR